MPRSLNPYDEAGLQSRLWTPDVLRPALWLDAADPSTITVATGISEWRDKSGNGRHFTQTTTASQPDLSMGTFNGANCVRFDGVNDVLGRAPEAWAFEYPIAHFCVFRARSFVPAYSALIDFYTSNAGNTAGWTSLIKSNGRSSVYTASTVGQPNYDGTGAATYAANTFYVWSSVVGNGDVIQSWQNGRLDASFSSAWTPRTNMGASNFTVGASAVFGRYTDWDIAAIIVLNLSSFAGRASYIRQRVEGYLAWAKGISLDASHPFCNRPPLIGD